MNINQVITDLISSPRPKAARLRYGLAVAYTPGDADTPSKLKLSRPPKKVWQPAVQRHAFQMTYPSAKEVEIVSNTLKHILPNAAAHTLKASEPITHTTPNGKRHGCVVLEWTPVHQEALL